MVLQWSSLWCIDEFSGTRICSSGGAGPRRNPYKNNVDGTCTPHFVRREGWWHELSCHFAKDIRKKWPPKVEVVLDKNDPLIPIPSCPFGYSIGKKKTGEPRKHGKARKGILPPEANNSETSTTSSTMGVEAANSLLDEALARINTPQLVKAFAQTQDAVVRRSLRHHDDHTRTWALLVCTQNHDAHTTMIHTCTHIHTHTHP